MNNNSKSVIALIAGLAVIVFLGWFFSDILIYVFASFVLSLLGTPLVKFLSHIKIGEKRFPKSLAAAITLLAILFCIALAFYFVIPSLVNEVSYLTTIDFSSVSESLEKWLNSFDRTFRKYGLIKRNQHVFDILDAEWEALVRKISMSSIVSGTASFVASFFVAVFSILFMTFFSLKDHKIFFKMIRSWLPNKYQKNFDNILDATGKQVSAYFRGVLLEMFIVGVIEFLVCLILKVPNALLIGVIGGSLNIIPYVGTIIAIFLSVIVGITSLIPLSPDMPIYLYTAAKIAMAFLIAKSIDDFILQPYIYGKQTHSHPLEIFIVILMAGYLGGVFAMIFAVPAYTLLRIVVNEFFGTQFASQDERVRMLAEEEYSRGNSTSDDRMQRRATLYSRKRHR